MLPSVDRPELPYEVNLFTWHFRKQNKHCETNLRFFDFLDADVGHHHKDVGEFVSVLAWNLAGKYSQGPNQAFGKWGIIKLKGK